MFYGGGSGLSRITQSDRRGRHCSTLTIFLLALVFLSLTSFIAGERIDPYDEGMHFLNYAMFKTGRLPYIDYYPLFPPLWIYAHIALEYLFGELLIIQRIWFVFQGALVAAACYVLLKRVTSSKTLALGVLGLIMVFGFDPFWLPRWSGARLAVYIGFVLFLRRHLAAREGNAFLRLFLLGLYVGLSNLYAFDVGIHLTITGFFIYCIVFLTRPVALTKEKIMSFAISFAGFFAPLIAWSFYLHHHVALKGYIEAYYYLYMVVVMPISAKILSGGYITLANPRICVLAVFLLCLGVMFIYVAGYLRFLRQKITHSNLLLSVAILLTIMVSVSTVRGTQGPQFLMFTVIPMLLWAGFIIDRAVIVVKREYAVKIFLFLAIFVGSIFLFKNVVVAKIVAFKDISPLFFNPRMDTAHSMSFKRPAALRFVTDTNYDGLVRYLEANTNVNEPVLAFPWYVEGLPALAGRPSATRYPIPVLLLGSKAYQLDYVAQIEKEKPRLILFYPGAKFGGIEPLEPFYAPVYQYIREHYSPADDITQMQGPQIWVRHN